MATATLRSFELVLPGSKAIFPSTAPPPTLILPPSNFTRWVSLRCILFLQTSPADADVIYQRLALGAAAGFPYAIVGYSAGDVEGSSGVTNAFIVGADIPAEGILVPPMVPMYAAARGNQTLAGTKIVISVAASPVWMGESAMKLGEDMIGRITRSLASAVSEAWRNVKR